MKRRVLHGALVGTLGASLLFCNAARREAPPATAKAATEDASVPAEIAPPAAPADGGSLAPPVVDEDALRWTPIDAIVQAAIEGAKMPGCMVVVGRHDDVLFERAYGARALLPERAPMTPETLFDLASLTKPIATATSIMILVDRGKVDLDARASRYVPELARLPAFTVRQLLLHTSGLPAATPLSDWSTDRAEVIRRIAALTPRSQPGERFNYSDVGFVVLQEIVQRVSGKELAAFASEEVFAPLGMKDTGFLPSPELRLRAAPTEQRDGGFILGEVHDPRAFALGGVGGHAGVFSTAHDLSRFARAMLARGELDHRRLFATKTFERFVARHDTSKGGRALGWDVDSAFATHRSGLFSAKAFGHGGYTGTAMWIDPERDLFVIFLSNRVHPDGKGAVNPVVSEIATVAVNAAEVKTGIDVLRAESFERLRGARVGLVTNASARAKDGKTTIDVLRAAAPAVTLAAIFTPEHGLGGDREGKIADGAYEGVPVVSLYGDRFTPTSESLAGVDTLVFDLQDVGVRFYTYASTMKRAMKVAAERHLRFVVLDRPNPIGGVEVQGPVLAETDVKGFVNHHALPLRHGMTMGELARLFAADDGLELELDVVKTIGWRRKETFDRTGLAWTGPSPNLRSLRSVALYPAVGLLESTNVSVGRGTSMPFEIVAAPWMDGAAVARRLNEAEIAGVAFEPLTITPTSSVHANKRCRGVRITVNDATRFEPVRTALAIAGVLRALHPDDWSFDGMDRMLRHAPAMDAIRAGKGLADVEATWALDLATFKARRARFLLYK
ncbi:MAG: DUF1343 domain-containing protein [Labilithrix sp.]|nr:DUF1343 domain-containing protein [Labilithrix sp.]